ncbi:hypothetical protein HJG60_009708 [Phyllostomus discolor]|uniref:Uncharacterized protein n=1 Tax=Phyllostomus discolor TaxID=89673 RepID=A0A834B8C5_9CHIR|nr:hypothetical protein HJG60_009708 [Phyllostomus discolor]
MQMKSPFSISLTRCPSGVFSLPFCDVSKHFCSLRQFHLQVQPNLAESFWSQFQEPNHFLLIQFSHSLEWDDGASLFIQRKRGSSSFAWGQSSSARSRVPDSTTAIFHRRQTLWSTFQQGEGVVHLWALEVQTVPWPTCLSGSCP